MLIYMQVSKFIAGDLSVIIRSLYFAIVQIQYISHVNVQFSTPQLFILRKNTIQKENDCVIETF